MRHPTTTKRPWGMFQQFTHNEKTTVKILTVLPNEALSLQYHKKREEYWYILGGNPTIMIDNEVYNAKPGDEFEIQKKQVHRIQANAQEVTILEIAFGTFDENDIVRLEDKYKRE